MIYVTKTAEIRVDWNADPDERRSGIDLRRNCCVHVGAVRLFAPYFGNVCVRSQIGVSGSARFEIRTASLSLFSGSWRYCERDRIRAAARE